MKYTLSGVPVPLARARHGRYSVYDGQKALRMHHGIELANQIKHEPHKNVPLRLDVIFYMPFPKQMSVKKKKELCGKAFIIRPDKSNLLKYIEDVATNAGLYHDDCLIVYGQQIKIYDYNPRTVFGVRVISPSELTIITEQILKEIDGESSPKCSCSGV